MHAIVGYSTPSSSRYPGWFSVCDYCATVTASRPSTPNDRKSKKGKGPRFAVACTCCACTCSLRTYTCRAAAKAPRCVVAVDACL